MKNIKYFLFAFLLGFTSCSDDEVPAEMKVNIAIENLMDASLLELDGPSYMLPSGEAFTPKKFKYFISNVKLTNSSTGESYTEPNSYHLISTGGKTSIDLGMIPSSGYDHILFSIGVDEVANGKTDQTGDLDPNSDMAWNWNTGYKFVVLEGEYTNSVTNERAGLVLHVGTNQNYREISQQLSGVRAGETTLITLVTNVDELFINPNTLPISQLASTTIMGGEHANKIAENYSEGFITVK